MKHNYNSPIIQSKSSISAVGETLVIHEWRGSGPDYMHVHYEDDEAWYIIEGSLTFKFIDREVEVFDGDSVFVPAGTPHTYLAKDESSRYLIILTPRLDKLIKELHSTSYQKHQEVMRKYKSEILS